MAKANLYLHLTATLFMVGLIWFVQCVHYPLFSHVTPELSASYEVAHIWRTVLLVGPVMALEGVTGLYLLWNPPKGVERMSVWVSMGLLAVIWASSFLFQVPLNALLTEGFSESAHHRLVLTNWIRTIGWSFRGFLVLKMVWRAS